jgi:alpha-aminoadipic semialdehyde synthase
MIAIRAEDKSRWERRAPLTPGHVATLVREHGIDVLVEPSAIRVFPGTDYGAAGARASTEGDTPPVVLGIKEIPPGKLRPETVYVFFAHVVKGQPHNMPMLRRLMELGSTLIDYEKVVDGQGNRLILFGRYAGLAGMLDTLWTLGRRFSWKGIETPFAGLRQTVDYAGLDEAKEAVREAGSRIRSEGLPEAVCPLIIGIAGYGNTSRGASEMLAPLPVRDIEPAELAGITARSSGARNVLFKVVFREEHTVESPHPERPFDLEHFRREPGLYRPRFDALWPHLSALVNCVYWEPRFPRLITKASLARLYMAEPRPRLEVIGDVSCDIEGAVECTVRATSPDEPVYVYDPVTGETTDGVAGDGPVVLAVDILPCELPVESSREFGDALLPLVPALARCQWDAPYERLALPPELRRAVIVHRGELTPPYKYLGNHLPA